MLRKGRLFLERKMSRIREGGVRAFFLKGQACWLELCLNIFAPAAVVLGLDWPQAYVFAGKKWLTRSKKILSRPTPDLALFHEAQNKAVGLFERATARAPKLSEFLDWMDAGRILHGLWWIKGELGHSEKVCQRIIDIRRSLAQAHQLDRLNMVFFPRFLAFGALGAYEYLCTYIKAEALSDGPVKQKILLVDPGTVVNNPCYLNYWRRYVTVITNPALIGICAALEKVMLLPVSMLMPFRGKVRLSNFLTVGSIRECWDRERQAPLLTITPEDEARGRACLKELGVPPEAWFVCLHVREGGRAENFRNADITTYAPAMEAVTAAGGWVIRMGDRQMQRLPRLSHVVDYAHSPLKSDWMDVFLSAQCRFFIGTSSGLYTVAMAFGVPVVATNYMSSYTMYCLTSKDIVLPRVCWDRREKRYLSFQELIAPPVGIAVSQRIYDELGLDIIPNTAEEIKGAVIEMLHKCDRELHYSEEDERLHQEFRLFSERCSLSYGDEKVQVNARLGTVFLRQHAALLTPGCPCSGVAAPEERSC